MNVDGAAARTVLLTDRPFGSDDIETSALTQAGLQLVRAPDTDVDTLVRLASQATAILVCYAEVGEEVVAAAASAGCKVIARYGIGYDNVAVAAAARHGIVVTNVPDYCTGEVADHTMALLLTLARGVLPAAQDVRAGGWRVPADGVHRLQGRRLALIGVGRIGELVAARARAFGLEVVAFDPYRAAWDEHITRSPSLESALASADLISLHVPLTDATRHLIGERELALLQRQPILVNTSRGGLIDLDAALRALDHGSLGGLALDVTEPEPLPADHALRSHARAVVTPHMAFYSAEAEAELQRRAVGEVVDVLAGRPPRNPVTLADSAR